MGRERQTLLSHEATSSDVCAGATDQSGKALLRGAEASGYMTHVWTLPRVAEVIDQLTGVAYHPGHVWYILRDQLRWSWQRPARQAVERDDAAIEQWVKQRWPTVKSTHGGRATTEGHESGRRLFWPR
jgi:transposase